MSWFSKATNFVMPGWLNPQTYTSGGRSLQRGGGGGGGGGQRQQRQSPNATMLPVSGPYAGLDVGGAFGTTGSYGNTNPFANVGGGDNRKGAGLYNLPEAFAGWSAPARYAFAPSLSYAQQLQPATDFYKSEMGKDYGNDLYNRSADIYEAQAKNARRLGQQGLARAGYGGGGAVSPFASLQVQQESAARAGALGSAARESVLQAQQMKAESARNYQNSLSSWLQAMLVPAQLQAQASSKVPGTNLGPPLIGPAMNLAASGISAFA